MVTIFCSIIPFEHSFNVILPVVIESVKDLETLAKCTTAPAIIEDDPLTTNTNLCKWCENVSPAFLKLSVPRKLSVLSILYGRYLGEDPLEFEEKDAIEDFIKEE